MVIYGVALLSGCMIAGVFFGELLGELVGVQANVGGVGIAAGPVKSVLVTTTTPFVARQIGLDNPRSALVFGGLMGTTGGVAGRLAATVEKLVPYGAMTTATFYKGLGCLLGPSIVFVTIRALFG